MMKAKLSQLFLEFFNSEKSGGLILLACTACSLLAANSFLGESYRHIWENYFLGLSVTHWINDGLMAVFFLLIGLELEREIYVGELSDLKSASLPIFGAIGGMLLPAIFYLLFNLGKPSLSGFGIPMATDIAFAVGILSLLGSRVPASLKVFLTALAVIDDLGAIMMIAIFYTKSISFIYLLAVMGIIILLFALNRLKVNNIIIYLIGGAAMWYFMLNSGVHATITGVILAFLIPFRNGTPESPSYKVQHFLHKPVAFLILPLFALANTSLLIGPDWFRGLALPGSLGIIIGLIIGKPVGIFLSSFLAVKLRISRLPEDLTWRVIFGAGMLAGIGFTMSIFIALLAFNQPELITNAKIAILISSLISGISGFLWLRSSLAKSMGKLV